MDALYFFDPDTGACTCYAGKRGRLSDEQMAVIEVAKCPHEGDLAWWGGYLGTADCVEARIDPETGEITAVEPLPTPTEKFLHVAITAPGTGPTGVPSVAAGEVATITAEVRDGEDPESDILPYGDTVRVPYRKNGIYHGEMRMVFVGGVCVYTFAPKSHHHGTMTIDEADLGLLDGFKVRIIGTPTLLVDEVSAV